MSRLLLCWSLTLAVGCAGAPRAGGSHARPAPDEEPREAPRLVAVDPLAERALAVYAGYARRFPTDTTEQVTRWADWPSRPRGGPAAPGRVCLGVGWQSRASESRLASPGGRTAGDSTYRVAAWPAARASAAPEGAGR